MAWWLHTDVPLSLLDWPQDDGLVETLELPVRGRLSPPEFILNLSGRTLKSFDPTAQTIHGGYLVQRSSSLLFGPNHLINDRGWWACESRSLKLQFLQFILAPFYEHFHPGVRPKISIQGGQASADLSDLTSATVEVVNDPIFLATPLEPNNWGRWLLTVIPKIAQFRLHGYGRRFYCYAKHDWQHTFLKVFGLGDSDLSVHYPGRTYACRDVMTVEQSVANLTVSGAERELIQGLAREINHNQQSRWGEKLFLSRRSHSARNPQYRVLQNEDELISCMLGLGFTILEPETLPIAEQVVALYQAKIVVALGGAGLFNVVFCQPGTIVITIESSDFFVSEHSILLASLGHRYGIIVGRQDPADQAPIHRRWWLDVPMACASIARFIS